MSKQVDIKIDIENFTGNVSGMLNSDSWAKMSASARSEMLKKVIDVIKRGFNAAAEEGAGGDGKRKRRDLGGGGSGEDQRSSKVRVWIKMSVQVRQTPTQVPVQLPVRVQDTETIRRTMRRCRLR